MRHRVYGRHLGRDKDERSRLFKTLLQALFTHGTIETSQDKAKAIKGLVDKVINLAKNKNSRRLLQSYINNKDVEDRLIKEIVPKLENRTSGFTSLVRLGTRLGDQTMMVRMSLIGVEELEPINKAISDKEKVKSKKVENTKEVVSEKKVHSVRSGRKTTSTIKGKAKSSKTK